MSKNVIFPKNTRQSVTITAFKQTVLEGGRMNQFTIHTVADDVHVGFLVMLPDDEHDRHADTGQFAVKITHPAASAALAQWSDNTELRWQIQKDMVQLFDEQVNNIGHIRQQYFTLSGEHFILNDLTGMI